MDLAATSTEYVKITVSAADADGPVDLAIPPKIAFLSGTGNPVTADWHAAEWRSGNARIRIGPAGGALTLTKGTYWTWITWAAGSETPVYRAGRTRIY